MISDGHPRFVSHVIRVHKEPDPGSGSLPVLLTFAAMNIAAARKTQKQRETETVEAQIGSPNKSGNSPRPSSSS
jgi:hypothetical protein